MKVSIITASFNSELFIESAINSVLNQSYNDIEYIIVDGLSSDNSAKIISSYNNRVTKFISDPDSGIYDALNKGIDYATGDIIAFLHSDDIYHDEKVVENVVQQFKNDRNLDCVYGDLVYTAREDISVVSRYWKSKSFKPYLLSMGWMPPHPTIFLKKEIYRSYGKFNLNYKISADYDFILRIFSKKIKTKYIPRVIYKMRLGGESNKSIINIIKKSREDHRTIKENKIGGIFTLLYKNFSKLTQFVFKEKIND